MLRRRALFAAPLVAGTAAQAQERPFPDGPVRIVSPYAPGGGTDVTSRLIAPVLSEFLGQPVLVENRGGAGGALGAAEVARSAPDGRTLLVDALGHVVNPHLLRDLAFDYSAFVPVTQITQLAQVLVTHPRTLANDLAGLVALIRSRPGQLSFGSSGNATGSHLASVLFLREAGLDIQHIPYRGGSAAMQDVLADNVLFSFPTVNSATSLVQDGRLKALAVASANRVTALPNVPTFVEAGFPSVVVDEWNGMFAPPGTPRHIVDRLHAGVRHALGTSAVARRFAAIGAITVGSDPDRFAAFVRERRDVYGRLVREANITID
ncbi:Bug family tripartite tricarboxylate transporter substrate binding protein [Sabulicella rubraurantiaca]|uniref:Bug family tripartite tricarboxylate transporter substrate binding protein n=1 Tax=Sabulicella rubraurantiaca TaxID=2811429 RepID=UPI001A97B4D9|nr:tripartite tricarboxylate transporter substrate-binding protein [Sabulicella rubraurantiaca]